MDTGSDSSESPSSNENGAQHSVYQLLTPTNASSDNLSSTSSPEDWWRERVQVSPEWEEVRSDLSWMWQLHTLGFASLFLILCIITFFTILGLRAQLSAKPHLSSLNLFVCLLSTSRCVILFVDPYSSTQVMPLVMFAILWDLAFPCLLSAFSLLQLAFLQMTRVKLSSTKISNETCVTLVVTSHFCLVIASDILWSLQNSLRLLWLVTQISYAFWGLFLCSSFLYGRVRLIRSKESPMVNQKDMLGDVGGVLQLGLVSRQQSVGSSSNGTTQSVSTKGSYAPKIRITDENDQTISYASDLSQPINANDACVISLNPASDKESKLQWTKRSKGTGGGVATSSQRPGSSRGQPADVSQCYPLTSEKYVQHSSIVQSSIEEASETGAMLPRSSRPISSISGGDEVNTCSRVPSIMSRNSKNCQVDSEFRFESPKYKGGCVISGSRLEQLIRKMTLTAVLGIIVCILQMYGVLGPHGLLAARGKPAVIPWFCYQTFYRLVEFVMGCAMAGITRQSFHMNCYPPFSVGAKYRESLFT